MGLFYSDSSQAPEYSAKQREILMRSMYVVVLICLTIVSSAFANEKAGDDSSVISSGASKDKGNSIYSDPIDAFPPVFAQGRASETDKAASTSEMVKTRQADFYSGRRYLIGDKIYTRDQIIADFLSIAFPGPLWFQYSIPLEPDWDKASGKVYCKHGGGCSRVRGFLGFPAIAPNPQQIVRMDFFKRYIPWGYEYVVRSEGFPKPDVLTRREGVVKIGFGFPPLRLEVTEKGGYFDRIGGIIEGKDKQKIVEAISAISKEIARATGLEVVIVDREDETASEYAFLRFIQPVAMRANLLKRSFGIDDPDREASHGMFSLTDFEKAIFGAVRFTQVSGPNQVDGYFVPDKDNKVTLAVCGLSLRKEEAFLKPLVAECILRALGLPEVSKMKHSVLLSAWADNGSPLDLSQGIPAYDKAMLNILYCPQLKVGMNKYDILKVLYQTDECFASLPISTEGK